MSLYQKLRIRIRANRYLKKGEPNEIQFVCDCLKAGMTAIDIGAHKAAFTYWMSKQVGRTGKVFAFEPVPPLAKYLQNYADTCWNQNITVSSVALSDHCGEGELRIPGQTEYRWASLEHESPSSSQDVAGNTLTLPVQLETLDHFWQTIDCQADLIKCDVELHELAVFRGARELLQNERPILLFESMALNHQAPEANETFQFLEQLGFQGHFFYDDELVSLDDYNTTTHVLELEHIQNFVFIHPAQWDVQNTKAPFRLVKHRPASQRRAA